MLIRTTNDTEEIIRFIVNRLPTLAVREGDIADQMSGENRIVIRYVVDDRIRCDVNQVDIGIGAIERCSWFPDRGVARFRAGTAETC